MRNMEFIIAYEDGTWQTEILEIPFGTDPIAWAIANEIPQSVYVGIYNENPEGEDV